MSKASFDPFNDHNPSAMDILIETILDRPELFTGRWFSVRELRDDLIHEYDLLRLSNTYDKDTPQATSEAITVALLHAVETAGWIERTGAPGVEMQWRVRNMPPSKPNNLADCYEMLDNMRATIRYWKDMGLALQDATIILRSMKMTVEDAQDKLNKGMSLVAMYRNRNKVLFDLCKENHLVRGTFHDVTAKELHAFMKDPKSESNVTELQDLHRLLQ